MPYSKEELDYVTRTMKQTALITHRNDPDEVLQTIVRGHSAKVMNLGKSDQDLFEAAKMLGEVEACSEIFAQRQKKRALDEKSTSQTLENWKTGLTERFAAAAAKLPCGTSANGQLVAAILEEAGPLSAEEIRAWYEELEALPDEEYTALLDGLCQERVIFRDKEDRYHFLCYINPELEIKSEDLMRRIKLLDTFWQSERYVIRCFEAIKRAGACTIEALKSGLGSDQSEELDFLLCLGAIVYLNTPGCYGGYACALQGEREEDWTDAL